MKNIYCYWIWFDLPLWFVDNLETDLSKTVKLPSEFANGWYCENCINSEFERSPRN